MDSDEFWIGRQRGIGQGWQDLSYNITHNFHKEKTKANTGKREDETTWGCVESAKPIGLPAQPWQL